jgi:hypothetical protein
MMIINSVRPVSVPQEFQRQHVGANHVDSSCSAGSFMRSLAEGSRVKHRHFWGPIPTDPQAQIGELTWPHPLPANGNPTPSLFHISIIIHPLFPHQATADSVCFLVV